MAGHTSEKRWRRNQNVKFGNEGVSELASQVCGQMISALDSAKQAFEELQEMYVYAGGTVQLMADQLFKEDWEERSTPGVKATLTVDVVSGVVTVVTITNAGTAYASGTGFTVKLLATAGGGDGAAVLSYDVVSGSVTNAAIDVGGAAYTDGTNQVVQEMENGEVIFETQANSEEVAKAQDLFDAITAVNELYRAANNQVTVTEDRFSQLRRMS